LGGVLITGILGVVDYQVILRYIFRGGIEWGLDVPTLFYVMITFLGLAYTQYSEGHIRVDIIMSRLSQRTQLILMSIFIIPALIMCAVMIWKGTIVTQMAWEGGWTTVASDVPIPETPRYIMAPIGFSLLALALLSSLYKYIKRILAIGKETETATEPNT
jgi:TRAP-type C4-dicarboxylate transport system permease small subunit